MNLYRKYIRRPFSRIGTVFSYLPILWRDHDWDHHYFFLLMQHKLRRMERTLRRGNHLYRDRTADEIKVCCLLLDRIIAHEYGELRSKEHDEKWGKCETHFIESENGDEHGSLVFSRAFATTPEEKERERKERELLFKLNEAQREQDFDLLFSTLRKHVQSWWD